MLLVGGDVGSCVQLDLELGPQPLDHRGQPLAGVILWESVDAAEVPRLLLILPILRIHLTLT